MSLDLDRRSFFSAGAAGLGYFFTASAVSANRFVQSPNETLRFAGIGVGGKGSSDVENAAKFGKFVALCDIDDAMIDEKLHDQPAQGKKAARKGMGTDIKRYHDYRKMFDKIHKEIDAVTVSTPDHNHALASLIAMQHGKHVYCQKPLTHTVFEARVLREAAKKYGVVTQMGNQGSAESGLRRAVEIIQDGIIGDVTEVHVWTNRPVWPQAPKITARPETADAWPKSIHWDPFIGGAKLRPYVAKVYHPFNWRGWWDFGTGAIGDMACHTANMAFRALKFEYPTSVSAESAELNPETYPAWARVKINFPARESMPAATLTWYEGKKDGKLVLPPAELLAKVLKPGEKLADSGSLLVGSKGILFSPNDYGAAFRITPDALAEGKNLSKPERTPINGEGDYGMKKEWVEAIKANKPAHAYSNFDIASLLTEAFLLGNVAIKTGKEILWDGPNLRVTNVPAANALIAKEYRRGWEVVRG
jgi:predicted dehydrogenase